MIQNFILDTKNIALSSVRTAYKTEGFVTLTRKMIAIDAFISRMAEALFKENTLLVGECFTAQTEDKRYTLFFKQMRGDKRLEDGDIV